MLHQKLFILDHHSSGLCLILRSYPILYASIPDLLLLFDGSYHENSGDDNWKLLELVLFSDLAHNEMT